MFIDAGADVSQKDKNGYTPLQMAVSWNRNKIAQLLLERGADVNESTQDDERTTPLQLAAEEGNDELAILRGNYGAQNYARAKKGDRPWARAHAFGHSGLAAILYQIR